MPLTPPGPMSSSPRDPALGPYTEVVIPSDPTEARRVQEQIERLLESRATGEHDLFGIKLALEEALVNAIKHGNRGDPTKEARLRFHANPEFVLLEVEDDGAGFDPSLVPDPLAPENLERPSGRGLFLIRQYMTWMEHNERGNCITMCKHRTAG